MTIADVPAQARRRKVGVLVVALLVIGALALAFAPPASAHATLISTDPAEGAVLPAAPELIRFTFNEDVLGVPDGVRVFDAQGGSVASSAMVSGPDLVVTLSEPIGEGTLVVVWRVVSEDGHPISGSLSFSIGAPSAEVARPVTDTPGASGVPRPLTVSRWLGYGGLLITAGLVAFAVLFLPTSHEARRARRRVTTAASMGAVLATVGWLAAVPSTALYQLGGGPGLLLEASTWSSVSPTEYTLTSTVVAGLALGVHLLGSEQPATRKSIAAIAATGVAVAAPALTGHTRAAVPEALVIATDTMHLVAASLWLGGLVGLVLTLPDLAARGSVGAEVLSRFSTVAAGTLVLLVVTGTVLAWRILGAWAPIVETAYGRLLLIKLGAVLAAVLIAAWNRYALLPRLQQAIRRRDRRAGAGLIKRSIRIEAAVLIVALAITGVLVDRSPDAEASATPAAVGRSSVKTAVLGDIEARVTITPSVVGRNTVTIKMTGQDGNPAEGLEAPRVRFASEDVDLGALPLRSIAPGVYTADIVVPTSGRWGLQVSLRTGEFDNPVTTLDLYVG